MDRTSEGSPDVNGFLEIFGPEWAFENPALHGRSSCRRNWCAGWGDVLSIPQASGESWIPPVLA
jgi:hypothetical protein